jgi:hypothetical protein
MNDLKSLLDGESKQARISVDALNGTLQRVSRRLRHRRMTAAAVALAVTAPAIVAIGVFLATRSNVRPGPSAASSPTSSTCPAYRGSFLNVGTGAPVGSDEQGASALLVPGRPETVTSCVYRPIAAEPGSSSLIASRDASGSMASLRSLLNALPVIPRGEVFSCPADIGSLFELRFTYPDGRHVIVAINLTGCQFASNGLVRARTTVHAQTVLARLLGVQFGIHP